MAGKNNVQERTGEEEVLRKPGMSDICHNPRGRIELWHDDSIPEVLLNKLYYAPSLPDIYHNDLLGVDLVISSTN